MYGRQLVPKKWDQRWEHIFAIDSGSVGKPYYILAILEEYFNPPFLSLKAEGLHQVKLYHHNTTMSTESVL